jgi:hypothetical protein
LKKNEVLTLKKTRRTNLTREFIHAVFLLSQEVHIQRKTRKRIE